MRKTNRTSDPLERQHVADAAHGLHEPGVSGVVAELRAQVRDVDVDRAIERLISASAYELDELFARQNTARALRQGAKERELVGGEGELAIAERGAHRLGLHAQGPDLDALLVTNELAARAPDLRSNAGEELAG